MAGLEDGLYWGSGVDPEGMKKDTKVIHMTVVDFVKKVNVEFSKIKTPVLKIDKSVLADTIKQSKVQQEQAKLLLIQAKNTDVLAAARVKNARAALLEYQMEQKLNAEKERAASKAKTPINDIPFTVYTESRDPRDKPTGNNVAANNEAIVASNNLSSAYQKQQKEALSTANANKTLQNSYFDISETYTKNASYLATLQNELKETQVAMRSKGAATAELSAKEKQLQSDIRMVESSMKAEYNAFVAAGGSINQLKANLAQLVAEYESLSVAEQKSAKGLQLSSQISKTETDLAKAKAAMRGTGNEATSMGSKVAKGAGQAFGLLRNLAYLIPGLGLAGIIGLITDGIIALVQELIKGDGAFDRFKIAVEASAEALKGGDYQNAKIQVATLTNEIELAKAGFIGKDKVVNHYNDTVGKTMGSVKSFAELEGKWSANAPAFIEIMGQKAKAMALYARAAQMSADAELESTRDFGFFEKIKAQRNQLSFGEKAGLLGKTAVGFLFGVQSPQQIVKSWGDATDKAVSAQKKENEGKLKKNADDITKLADGIMEDAAKKSKTKGFDIFGGDYDKKEKKPKNTSQKDYQQNKALEDLLKKIDDSEGKYDIQFGSNIESETDKINNYFNDLKKEVENFNKNPKNKLNPINETKAFADIEKNRQHALDLANYDEGTKNLINQLNNDKAAFKDYEDFKSKYGKESANKLYADLLKRGNSYYDELKKEESALEDQKKKNTLSVAGNARLFQIKKMREDAEVDNASENTKWLADALSKYQSFQQQRLAITEHFNEEIKKAEEKGQQDLIPGIENARRNALAQIDSDNLNTITSTRQMFDDVVLITTESVKQQIEKIEYLLKNTSLSDEQRSYLTGKLDKTKNLLNINPNNRELQQTKDRIAEIDAEIKKAKDSGITTGVVMEQLLKDKTAEQAKKTSIELDRFRAKLQVLSDLAPAVSDLGQSLQELGGENSALSDVGAAVSGIGSQLGNLITVFDKVEAKSISSMDAISAAAQFVIQTISMIISSAAQRKAAEKQYEIDRLNFQYSMNDAVYEELEVRQAMNRLSFSTDWSQDMKDAIEKRTLALEKYQEAFKDLDKVQAKLGQKNKVDWGKVGSNTLSGVAAGAAIGSVVPVIGTAVGAIVGGVIGFVTGLFGGKKKKDVWGSVFQEWPDLVMQTTDGMKVLNVEMAKNLIANNIIDDKGKVILQNIINQAEEYKKAYEEISKIVDDVINDLGDQLRNNLVEAFKAGEDAANVFKKTVSSIIEELISQAAYAAIFEPLVENLKKEMKDSYAIGGDMNWIDDLMRFMDGAEGAAQGFYDFLEAAKTEGKDRGLDLFSSSDKTKSTNSVSGSIQQITQQQADVLTGQFYAQTTVLNEINSKISKEYFIDSAGIMNRQLGALDKIQINTWNTVDRLDKAVVSLESIDKKMNNTANQAAAAGYKI